LTWFEMQEWSGGPLGLTRGLAIFCLSLDHLSRAFDKCGQAFVR
jgi:hypothetical protein